MQDAESWYNSNLSLKWIEENKICRSLEINKLHGLRSVTMKLQCAGLLLWGGSSVLVQSIGVWSAVLFWIDRRTADTDCAPLIYCQASSGCQRIYKAPMMMWQGRTLYTSSLQHIAVPSRNWLFFSIRLVKYLVCSWLRPGEDRMFLIWTLDSSSIVMLS